MSRWTRPKSIAITCAVALPPTGARCVRKVGRRRHGGRYAAWDAILNGWFTIGSSTAAGTRKSVRAFSSMTKNAPWGNSIFLYRSHGEGWTHWETAVKFYLHHPCAPQHDCHFIGPNAADTLERKIRRLFDHQLPLSDTRGERSATLPRVTSRHPFVKGFIFYRPEVHPPAVGPEKLHPQHARGIWIFPDEVERVIDLSGRTDFCVMEKPCWLAALGGHTGEVLPHFQLVEFVRERFRRRPRPTMLSALQPPTLESGGACFEHQRILVVPDTWPALPNR